jgi:hypothetical protein
MRRFWWFPFLLILTLLVFSVRNTSAQMLTQTDTPTPTATPTIISASDIAVDLNDAGAYLFPPMAAIGGAVAGLMLIVNLTRPFWHFFEERESLQ